MSQVKLFAPFVGIEGIMDEVVKIVSDAGANPCPPIIVGVGIGGDLIHIFVNTLTWESRLAYL